MSNPDIEQVKKQAHFDRNMALATSFRMRGEYDRAEELIVEALSLFPDNLDAREFAADLLNARGELEKAAQHYKSLFSPENPRPSAEEKYARVVVMLAESQRQRGLLEQMLENPAKFRKQTANPYLAALISVAPGLGSIYGGKLKKGIILFCSALLCWIVTYLLAPPVDQTLNVHARTFAFVNSVLSFPTFIFVAAAIGIAVYSIIDSAVSIDKERSRQMKQLEE